MSAARPPIAVLGMGCRFPGADGLGQYWQLLRDGTDGIVEVPPDRWDEGALWSADPHAPGKTYARWGGFLPGADRFDAALFGIAADEAARMDPQQGLVLECAWEALEHAALSPHALAGTDAGVYVGISNCDFDRKLCHDLENLDLRGGTGTSYSIVANRLSYALGLCGPSIAVDLACASSLVAIHLACQSLWLEECALALAGGTHLILSPEKTITFSQGEALARDGRCKSFAAAADGYVRGEGCGMVVLKPLADALRDGDPVRAVIRGTAANHNGASNGLSAPLGRAQQQVIRRALAVGGIAPASIGYVEAHGTGTLLGDAIEAKALQAVLGEGRGPGEPCLIGSVKSNVGHLEGAAGVAGFIKAALALEHAWVPASLHAATPSPHLRLDGTPFRVAAQPQAWPRAAEPRRAGVSSFSFGGANAHVVLEEAPARAPRAQRDGGPWLLALSARSPAALRALAGRHARYLAGVATANGAAPPLGDVCYTAAVGRAHLPHRLALAFDGLGAAIDTLTRFADGAIASGTPDGAITSGTADEALARVAAGCALVTGTARLRRASVVVCYRGDGDGDGDADGDCDAGGVAAARSAVPAAWRAVWDEAFAAARAEIAADAEAVAARDRDAVAALIATGALLERWGVRAAAVCGAGELGRSAARHVARRTGVPLADAAADEPARVVLDIALALALAPHAVTAPHAALAALAAAYAAGALPDWRPFFGRGSFERLALPTYPFERSRFWSIPKPRRVALDTADDERHRVCSAAPSER